MFFYITNLYTDCYNFINISSTVLNKNLFNSLESTHIMFNRIKNGTYYITYQYSFLYFANVNEYYLRSCFFQSFIHSYTRLSQVNKYEYFSNIYNDFLLFYMFFSIISDILYIIFINESYWLLIDEKKCLCDFVIKFYGLGIFYDAYLKI